MRSRLARAVAAVGLVGVVLAGTGSGVALAEPSAEEVSEQIERLNRKVDKLTERYNTTKMRLEDLKKRVSRISRRITAQRKKLARIKEDIGEAAADAYRAGGVAPLVAVLTAKTPEELLHRATSLNTLARQRQAQIREYESRLSRLENKKAAAQRLMNRRAKLEKRLQQRKESIEDKLEEKRDLLAEVRVPQTSTSSGSGVTATYTGPATGSARAAIEFAYAQVGEPYQWGAAGPDAWDCSGLTMAAWAAGGVSLPHSSQAQYYAGPHVAKSNLQPGDLVFFGSPIHHVGIYVGNGKMVHATHPGSTVQVDSINSGWYAANYTGAVRP